MNAFEQLNQLWDELIINHFYCKHEECPYQDCMYHIHSTKPNYFVGEDIPGYMPRSTEDMKRCMNWRK